MFVSILSEEGQPWLFRNGSSIADIIWFLSDCNSGHSSNTCFMSCMACVHSQVLETCSPARLSKDCLYGCASRRWIPLRSRLSLTSPLRVMDLPWVSLMGHFGTCGTRVCVCLPVSWLSHLDCHCFTVICFKCWLQAMREMSLSSWVFDSCCLFGDFVC